MEESTLWYKDAIIYEVNVKSFKDSSGDGLGDFHGLTQKLDYLQNLGITAIWLLPFFPSPLKDDGYDISDYKNIHPQYGTLNDFKFFLKQAHKRNIRVIIELVINHTSDQHPWFQRARYSKKNSTHWNYYVWSDDPEKFSEARVIFKDFESSNWSWDPVAKSYFWHRFYSHQPDLNFANPQVQQEIFKVLDFWLRIGVDGFRLDAVPYLFEEEGTNCENLPQTHQFLQQLRKYVDDHYTDRMFLAEANQWPEDAAKYFGDGNECNMAFHFPIMPRLFMSIHLEDTLPIIEIEKQTPPIPENCQWALFLRNHDELTLEMVTDEERDYMFRIYAHDVRARINLGIRRRLAPLLKNDRRKIELMNSLLFSLGGTPVIYYGDEIGMGDNIYLGDRDGVRTPMQWSPDRNAGFSKANPQRLYLPPIIDPAYHYETINVESQETSPFSLLSWTKQMILLRKRHKAFGRGTLEFLNSENNKVLCFIRKYQDEQLLIFANLSRHVQFAQFDLSSYQGTPLVELFSGSHFPKIEDRPYAVMIAPYSYYWFSIGAIEKLPTLLIAPGSDKIPTLTFTGYEETLFSPVLRKNLDYHLTHYLAYSDMLRRKTRIEGVELVDFFILISDEKKRYYLCLFDIRYNEYETEKYFLILGFLDKEQAINFPDKVISRWIDPAKKEMYLCDFTYQKEMGQLIFSFFMKNAKYKGYIGELQRVIFPDLTAEKLTLELNEPLGSKVKNHNLEVCYRNLIIKILIPNDDGINIDIEMRTFLMEHSSFCNFFPLIAYIQYHNPFSSPVAMASFIRSEEHGWHALDYFVEEMERFFENFNTNGLILARSMTLPEKSWMQLVAENIPPEIEQSIGGHLEIIYQLAETTSQFHFAMNTKVNDSAFTVEFFNPFYQRSLYQSARKKTHDFIAVLRKLYMQFPHNQEIEKIVGKENELIKFFEKYLALKGSMKRLRIHGDYTLDYLFFTGKQFLIANFDSNAELAFNERRFKRSPLRDVSSMLYSLFNVGVIAIARLDQKGLLTEEKKIHLREMAMSWSIWVGVGFLKTYLEKMDQFSIIPQNKELVDQLIAIYFFEKFLERCSINKMEPDSLLYHLQCFSHWFDIYKGNK